MKYRSVLVTNGGQCSQVARSAPPGFARPSCPIDREEPLLVANQSQRAGHVNLIALARILVIAVTFKNSLRVEK